MEMIKPIQTILNKIQKYQKVKEKQINFSLN